MKDEMMIEAAIHIATYAADQKDPENVFCGVETELSPISRQIMCIAEQIYAQRKGYT